MKPAYFADVKVLVDGMCSTAFVESVKAHVVSVTGLVNRKACLESVKASFVSVKA